MELFFSYSHRDEELRGELEKHLALLRRQGVISSWHDRRISAGTEWAGAVSDHIRRADVVLLLVSADFLASDYCYDTEVVEALKRHDAGQARVIPVILRSVDWHGASFGHLQALPRDGRPVTSWSNRDEAFTDVVRGIKEAIGELLAARPGPRETSHYFSVQTQLIEDLAKAFVGRHDTIAALDRFVSTERRGYFIVQGGPGQGKTAFAAYTAKTRGWPHHFISRTGGRSDVRLILCSLLSQMPGTANYGGTAPELTKALEDAVIATARKMPSFGIVIDALDELPSEPAYDPLFLMIDTLPANAYWVVCSRPCDRLDTLKARLFDTPTLRYELPPLASADVHAMIAASGVSLSPSNLTGIVDAAGGNPLYVRTALELARSGGAAVPRELPPGLLAYYKHATSRLTIRGTLRKVLGVLAVSRRALSARELAQIIGETERDTHEGGVWPIVSFLKSDNSGHSFYHQYFHEFVTSTLLYRDELPASHRLIADWLDRPEHARDEYRLNSFAHHLYESGDGQRLRRSIDTAFLLQKTRRLGYGVLEDLEYLNRSYLDAGDPGLVEECVRIVESLRTALGSEGIDEVTSAVQLRGSLNSSRRSGLIAPPVPSIPTVDLYVGMLPRSGVSADFVEIVPRHDRLMLAIGDAPSSGIKSAFVARFIANLFRTLVVEGPPASTAQLLEVIHHRIVSHAYFEWVSMQCVEIDPAAGVMRIASAGHPAPVVYSAERDAWDCLPVYGELLHRGGLETGEPRGYHQRLTEIAPGDIVVLVSDGLTELSARFGDAFGYRFADALSAMADKSAREVGEAVLRSWQEHPRAEDWADDVSVIVAKLRGREPRAASVHPRTGVSS